jgi:hypothetical protein
VFGQREQEQLRRETGRSIECSERSLFPVFEKLGVEVPQLVDEAAAMIGASFQVEDLLQSQESFVRTSILKILEEWSHFPLPPRVDFLTRHAAEGRAEIGRFEVTDEQAIVSQE